MVEGAIHPVEEGKEDGATPFAENTPKPRVTPLLPNRHYLDPEELRKWFDSLAPNKQNQIESSKVVDLFPKMCGKDGQCCGNRDKMMGGFKLTDGEESTMRFERFCEYFDKYAAKRGLNTNERVYLTLDDAHASYVSAICSNIVMMLILVSSATYVMETMPSMKEIPQDCVDRDDFDCEKKPKVVFRYIETVCILVFTLEYGLRFLTAHASRPICPDPTTDIQGKEEASKFVPPSGPVQKTWKMMTKMMALVDLVAILPWYIGLIFGSSGGGLAVLRILRLARVFRVFKLGKYNQGMYMFGRVLINSVDALLLLLFFLMLGIVLFGSLIYSCERGEWYGPGVQYPGSSDTVKDSGYPDGVYLRYDVTGLEQEVTPFQTIPHSFWWVMTTVTTVGYGDLYPTSVTGKLVGALTMLSGILALALPITIIGSNFEMEYNLEKSKREQEMREKEEAKAFDKKRRSLAGNVGGMVQSVSSSVSSMAGGGRAQTKAARRAQAAAGSSAPSPGPAMKATDFGQSAEVGDAALALEQCAEENGGSRATMLIDEVAKISKSAKEGTLTGEALDTFLIIALGCLRDSNATQELRTKILMFASQISSQLS